ncbi:hypothetical protein B0A48_00798 [Cryoendolithus antarcticus]|uniref:Uncharacterized protein n=1 Tax=Cryoendolithus antarcticus TaxID=1507870 RepID=A0A1V8TRA8_9PEZI|nr:hypothetical protein B0A48_00798 [Cryoendolithus antarcticus]
MKFTHGNYFLRTISDYGVKTTGKSAYRLTVLTTQQVMSSTALMRPAAQPSTPSTVARQTSQSPAARTPVSTPSTRLPSILLTPKTSQVTAIPASSPATQLTPSQSTPGKWQHPRMEEVVKRQHANHFDADNVRAILVTVAGLVSTLAVKPALNIITSSTVVRSSTTSCALLALRVLLVAALAFSARPLWQAPDTCEDIPLSAPQRHALGLPPLSRPATPQEQAQYVTPPRYSRSNSPSLNDSVRAQARGSPLSGRGSPLDSSLRRHSSGYGSPLESFLPSQSLSASPSGLQRQRSGSGSPYSPLPDRIQSSSSANDLLRRSSFGFDSPRRETETYERGSGSPSGLGKSGRASVGLNSKWLYQKGRGSPAGMASGKASPTGSGWGTGSVFGSAGTIT